MFSFSITQWQAWAPGIDTTDAWREWAHHPYCPLGDGQTPDLGFLPSLQRRRLSPLARISLGCAWPLAAGRAPMPVVYASHHGETPRGYELLTTLAAEEPLSPTAFSLSVHNAIAGLWSILRQETQESVALSAQGDGMESAVAEACMLLHAGHPDVLVILAETRPPRDYAPWIDDVPFSYAVALRLTAGQGFHLALDESPADDALGAPAWPSPLSLLRHLLLDSRQWRHTHGPRAWQWRRPAAPGTLAS
ncbi:beta-ketoacyl synthase chain length factor [Bordetella genomosp. 13]|uniref:beta-ketoacyl synthase chain length factor n=1 Tax=Bordetella genomosp. 13 TaxID=463040 RepID=UPI0011A7EE5B|nr:beta-ketoacyl synthase chain length factor [Bordetella genomosp. 13]